MNIPEQILVTVMAESAHNDNDCFIVITVNGDDVMAMM
jgi:hypothetical protein